MNSILVLVVGIGILIAGYVFYGKWLAEQWGVDPKRKTPAFTEEDGVDYVPAKAPVLMGHHFSSIAGAGPINGPIQAAVFGWVPVLLWVLIGGIFFGGVHDYGALFASLRHKGQSIGEVIADTMGSKAKKLFIVFAYLTLILVVAAFGSIVANTFKATYTESGAVDVAASSANATTAMIPFCSSTRRCVRFHGIQKKCISWHFHHRRRCSYRCLRCCWIKLPSDLSLRDSMDGNRWYLYHRSFCCTGLDSASAA